MCLEPGSLDAWEGWIDLQSDRQPVDRDLLTSYIAMTRRGTEADILRFLDASESAVADRAERLTVLLAALLPDRLKRYAGQPVDLRTTVLAALIGRLTRKRALRLLQLDGQ